MPYFVCNHSEKNKHWTFEVDSVPILIGRSRSATLCLRDVSVSKEHVRIEWRGGRFHFRDLGSRNGTYINDLTRESGPLHDGDEIRVGKIMVSFYRQQAPEKRASPSAEKQPVAAPNGPESDKGPAGAETPPDRAPPVPDAVAHLAGPALVARTSGATEMVRWSRRTIALICVSCLAAGFFVGRLTSRPEAGTARESDVAPQLNVGTAPELKAQVNGGTAPELKAQLKEGTEEDVGAGDEIEPLTLGPPYDMSDPEISRRALYRLCLDLLDRSPTREEFSRLLPLSREERWNELLRKAGGPTFRSFAGVHQHFLGTERSELDGPRGRNEASGAGLAGDPQELAKMIAWSSLYASDDNRRQRSPRQKARSLWVDLLDHLPTEENTETILRALEEHGGDPSQTIKMLLESRAAAIGPHDLEQDLTVWIRETCARFLSRYPTAKEDATMLAGLGQGDNWRSVLLEIALRKEYDTY